MGISYLLGMSKLTSAWKPRWVANVCCA